MFYNNRLQKIKVPSAAVYRRDAEHLTHFYRCPIDQYAAEDFCKNDAGWSRNDLSQLARAQSYEMFQNLLSRLETIQDMPNLPQNLTPEKAVRLIRSRYLQSPNELQEFAEHVAKLEKEAQTKAEQEAARKAAEQAALAAEQAKYEEFLKSQEQQQQQQQQQLEA